MTDQAPRKSVAQTAQRLLAVLVFAVLVGAVLWLLSERHARTFTVEEQSGELCIMRGRQLPTGYSPYRPDDKILAQAYANIPMYGDSAADLTSAVFNDRDELDQALFRTLRGWIESRLEAEDAERLTQALKLLRRIELLSGINAEQRAQLRQLQGKAGWIEGRARLEEAESALREAVAKLKLAADSRGKYARESAELLDRIAGLSDQLTRAARAALGASTAEKPTLPPLTAGSTAGVAGPTTPAPPPTPAPAPGHPMPAEKPEAPPAADTRATPTPAAGGSGATGPAPTGNEKERAAETPGAAPAPAAPAAAPAPEGKAGGASSPEEASAATAP